MVISLMMNNILFGIGFWIIKTYLATTGVTGTSSAPFVQSARLTTIIPRRRYIVYYPGIDHGSVCVHSSV